MTAYDAILGSLVLGGFALFAWYIKFRAVNIEKPQSDALVSTLTSIASTVNQISDVSQQQVATSKETAETMANISIDLAAIAKWAQEHSDRFSVLEQALIGVLEGLLLVGKETGQDFSESHKRIDGLIKDLREQLKAAK